MKNELMTVQLQRVLHHLEAMRIADYMDLLE